MIRLLVPDDAFAMIELYLEHDKFQGFNKQHAWYRESDIDARWVQYANDILWEDEYKVFGAFDDDSNLLAFVITKSWNDPVLPGWLFARMMATKKFVLSKDHGGDFWPDCLIDCVNAAVVYYEEMGKVVAYTQRSTVNRNWVPITTVQTCLLSKYHSDIMETVKGGEISENYSVYHHIFQHTILTVEQQVVRLTKSEYVN